MSDEHHERNSTGERLYRDTAGAKCNIRGMIRREPEWVASRFEHMMDELARLREQIQSICGDVPPAEMAEWLSEHGSCFDCGDDLLSGPDAPMCRCEACEQGYVDELARLRETVAEQENHIRALREAGSAYIEAWESHREAVDEAALVAGGKVEAALIRLGEWVANSGGEAAEAAQETKP